MHVFHQYTVLPEYYINERIVEWHKGLICMYYLGNIREQSFLGYEIDKFKYVILCVCLENRNRIPNIIDEWGLRECWVQFIPACLTISTRVVILATRLALRDFIRGDNIARKPNLEIGLRFLARTQVREILEIFRSIIDVCYWMIIVSKRDVGNIAERIIEQEKICVKDSNLCMSRADLGLISKIYKINKNMLERICKSRGSSRYEILERIILEKIALGKTLR